MQRTRPAVVVVSATILLVLGSVTGCAAKAPGAGTGSQSQVHPGLSHPSSLAKPPTPTATVSATPKPSGPPPLPANALFQISATVTASSNGASADLIQTVYKPVGQNPADMAVLDAACNFGGGYDWAQLYPNSLFLDTTMVSKLHTGSPAFLPDDQVNFAFGAGPSGYSGDWAPFEAACDSEFIKNPGNVHGVAPVPASDPAHGTNGWAHANSAYGFWAGGNQPGTPDSGGTAVVSNCLIQLSADAKAASAAIAAWATQAYVTTNGCDYTA
jgi:hypothetical protein